MKHILVIHGPNLNLLGKREPQLYGATTLAEINQNLYTAASRLAVRLTCTQSNQEAELINAIHHYGLLAETEELANGIIINPAAFTHTSVALRDALLAVNIPFIEVHLSNIYQRENFRQHSYFSDKAIGVISGLGHQGYNYALQFMADFLQKN